MTKRDERLREEVERWLSAGLFDAASACTVNEETLNRLAAEGQERIAAAREGLAVLVARPGFVAALAAAGKDGSRAVVVELASGRVGSAKTAYLVASGSSWDEIESAAQALEPAALRAAFSALLGML